MDVLPACELLPTTDELECSDRVPSHDYYVVSPMLPTAWTSASYMMQMKHIDGCWFLNCVSTVYVTPT